jgi:hypothetical protein
VIGLEDKPGAIQTQIKAIDGQIALWLRRLTRTSVS